jgi:hypothetical protein
MGPQNIILSLLMVCLSAGSSIAQSGDHPLPESQSDFHLREDQGRRLYSISAFAHGHRHGYEEGYRTADLEIHVGRQQRELRDKDIPKADYAKGFGDKKFFRQGYAQGFKAGYKDSYSNRNFRLVQWSEQIPPFDWMSELPEADRGRELNAKVRAQFEDGMAQGYASGAKAEVTDADAKAVASYAARSCGDRPGARPEGFCEGFTQGFLLGVNDQRPVPLAPESGLAQHHPQPQ